MVASGREVVPKLSPGDSDVLSLMSEDSVEESGSALPLLLLSTLLSDENKVIPRLLNAPESEDSVLPSEARIETSEEESDTPGVTDPSLV